MASTGTRTGWMAALIALFVAVFVMVPTVDAATCGVEAAPAQHSQSVGGADLDHGDGGVSGGLSHSACTHGHCHHGGSAPYTGGLDDTPPFIARPLHDRPIDDRNPSRVPDGLERPPRV